MLLINAVMLRLRLVMTALSTLPNAIVQKHTLKEGFVTVKRAQWDLSVLNIEAMLNRPTQLKTVAATWLVN